MGRERVIGGVLIALHMASLTPAVEAPTSAGEVVLSESFLEQLEFVGHRTKPFPRDGRMIQPDLKLSARHLLMDSSDGVKVTAQVGLHGTSTTHERREKERFLFKRLGPKVVDVTVNNQVDADYIQELTLEGGQLKKGKRTGYPTITPSISTSNNYLLNGLVNRIAFKKTSQIVRGKLPGEMAKLDREITSNIESSLDTAQQQLEATLVRTNSVLAQYEDLPFESKLSSKGGGNGFVKLQLFDKDGVKHDRKAPPKFEREGQAAARTRIPADMLASSVATEIAGKELKISEFRKALCNPRTAQVLDFCRRDLPAEVKDVSVLFDDKKPVEFIFEKGNITVRLNALYRTRDGEEERETDSTPPLLKKPDSTGVKFQTVPYSAEFTYKLGDGSATLDSVRVKERNNAFLQAGMTLFGAGDHGSGSTGRDLAACALSATIRTKIENGLRGAMAEKIEFAPVSIPVKLGGKDGGAPTILQAGTIFPLEVMAQDGWLAVSGAFCSETTRPLGVSLVSQKDQGGTMVVQMSSVTPGSPADLAGLKFGEVIDGFGIPGERRTTVSGDSDEFLKFVAERSKSGTPEARTIELSGRDLKGKPWTREITLCPSGYPHRANAEKTLAAVK